MRRLFTLTPPPARTPPRTPHAPTPPFFSCEGCGKVALCTDHSTGYLFRCDACPVGRITLCQKYCKRAPTSSCFSCEMFFCAFGEGGAWRGATGAVGRPPPPIFSRPLPPPLPPPTHTTLFPGNEHTCECDGDDDEEDEEEEEEDDDDEEEEEEEDEEEQLRRAEGMERFEKVMAAKALLEEEKRRAAEEKRRREEEWANSPEGRAEAARKAEEAARKAEEQRKREEAAAVEAAESARAERKRAEDERASRHAAKQAEKAATAGKK
jgi:hypothetical protein